LTSFLASQNRNGSVEIVHQFFLEIPWNDTNLGNGSSISQQTGKPENHRLKSAGWDGICDPSLEKIVAASVLKKLLVGSTAKA